MHGNKGRLFKANEIAEIDEDVADGISSLLGTLETRPRTRMVEAPDYDNHLYIESRNTVGANGTSGDQTSRVINVRASLPPRGKIIKNKLPPIPLKTEVRPAV